MFRGNIPMNTSCWGIVCRGGPLPSYPSCGLPADATWTTVENKMLDKMNFWVWSIQVLMLFSLTKRCRKCLLGVRLLRTQESWLSKTWQLYPNLFSHFHDCLHGYSAYTLHIWVRQHGMGLSIMASLGASQKLLLGWWIRLEPWSDPAWHHLPL